MIKNCRKYLLVVLLLCSVAAHSQNIANVHVIVEHKKSGKLVEGASVTIQPIQKTFETNKMGAVEIGLPYSFYQIEISTPISKKLVKEVDIQSDTSIFFMIEEDFLLLDDVEITENQIDQRIGQNVMSVENITKKQVERLPLMAGEKDPVKAAAFMPGIQTGSEGSADLLVRGGTPDQNLYLLDNAKMYHSNHLYGFLSSYNPLLVSKVDIYKGDFPSRFGGKLSAIVDARTEAPRYNDFEGEASLGLISSSLYLTTPIIKDKVNFMVAGRRSFYDVFVKIFNGKNNHELYNFHDLNAKLSVKLNENNEISFSTYHDRDLYKEADQHVETNDYSTLERKWSNEIYNFTWNGNIGIFKNRLDAYYSRFRTSIFDFEQTPDEYYKTTFSSYIKDYTLKYQADIEPSNLFAPYFGLELSQLNVLGSGISYEGQDEIINSATLPINTWYETNFFGGLNMNTKKWKFDLGARLSLVHTDSITTRITEPRASVTYSPDNNRSIKAGYSKMSQSLHMLTNPGLGMPIDVYVPSNQFFTPEISNQVAMGYIQNFDWLKHKWDFNTELYYKTMKNIIEYRDGYSSHVFTSPFSSGNEKLADIITDGNGRSYGFEFFLRKNTGDLTGSLAYTLSWTQHKFADLNEGNYFPARHDIRHNVAVTGSYKINNKWRLNASWQYKTGQAITLPLQTYPAPYFTLIDGNIRPYDGVLTNMYAQSKRNEYRMKAFHVLNISVQRSFSWKKLKGVFEFGLYNTYNRKNPYYYYYENTITPFEREVTTSLKSVSIFPVVPSLSIKINF